MNSLGIYLGPKLISIAESKNKKLINSASIPQSIISSGEIEEKVPPEVKLIEIIALIKDELAKNKIEAKEATLCLCGKDIIVRSFEIPSLPKEELKTAIIFEAKKYIPFKVEEIIFDYQVEADKESRTNQVLFTGIKKETLDKYTSVLGQLNIKINAIEYSAFSLLRCLKLAGLSDAGVIGFLGADIQGQDEVNFAVLENGFPLFSRDISLAGGPAEGAKAQGSDPSMALEKLKTEIRVSLDYYNRKFPTKNIKKLFFIAGPEQRPDLEAFLMGLGVSAQFVDLANIIGKPAAFSLSLIKGFSASLSQTIKTNIKTNLLTALEKMKLAKEKAAAHKEAAPLLEGVKLDKRIIFLAVLICVASYVFGSTKIAPLRKAVNSLISKRPQVAGVSADTATVDELTTVDFEYKRKLNAIDNAVKKQLFLTGPLNVIPSALPEGIWLQSFRFQEIDLGKELVLSGAAYLGDSEKEFEAVNKFVSNLKENADFNKYFGTISVSSIDQKQIGKVTVTVFSLACKTY